MFSSKNPNPASKANNKEQTTEQAIYFSIYDFLFPIVSYFLLYFCTIHQPTPERTQSSRTVERRRKVLARAVGKLEKAIDENKNAIEQLKAHGEP